LNKWFVAIVFSVLVLVFSVNDAVANHFPDSFFDVDVLDYSTDNGNIRLQPPSQVDTNPINIPLIGDPLPGLPDTIIERDPTLVPPQGGSTGPIPTEMVQLELKSVAPITVSSGDMWDVKVELGLPPFPTGTMTINKDSPDGGVFSSSLPVQPKFIFTRVSDGMVEEQFYDLQFDLDGQEWRHDPCSNSFFPIGTTNWVITGTGPSTGAFGSLAQNTIPIESHCIVVAGEIIPIESTSLILAGAQTFSWMIPVLLSGVGIGLFVFRKSENS